ncbi:MAG: hypothetical protein ACI9QV_001240 [Methylophagaceae bacterium]|jgi:hypothetical protein
MFENILFMKPSPLIYAEQSWLLYCLQRYLVAIAIVEATERSNQGHERYYSK